MPDSNNTEELRQQIVEARPLIAKEVQYACRKYNHGAPPDEVEDLTEQIIFLLMEDDCRRWKTYDPAKAKLNTWLRRIISNEVIYFFQEQLTTEPLEDLSEGQIRSAATQEEELLAKEQHAILLEAIATLTPRDQRLVRLKLNGASDEAIAQAMKVKPRSVQQKWSRIGKKLKTIIETMGGGQTLCHVGEWRIIFL
jgi:RNA polymerase sigma factor (sigma-70 family)